MKGEKKKEEEKGEEDLFKHFPINSFYHLLCVCVCVPKDPFPLLFLLFISCHAVRSSLRLVVVISV